MHRPSRLFLVLAAVLGACSSPDRIARGERGEPIDSGHARPNLVVILADDAGAECFGCYGGESYPTPNIDALAREGVRFANAFTQPLCTPTRLELLTGRSNARNYVAFSVLPPDELTFAEVLREAGYRTFAAGKWQLLAAEHYREGIRGTGSTPEQAGFDRHALWQVESLGERHWGPTMTIDGETQVFPDDRYGPDVALDAALDWIGTGDNGPFLLYWPLILPHDPFLAPPGWNGPHSGPSDPTMFGPTIQHLDRQVGRLLSHLRRNGLAENTVVMFIGDNGTSGKITSVRNGVELKGAKRKPIDAGSRVPFIVRGADGASPGRVIESPVSTVDVFATVLELAGEELPNDRPLDGWSFLPLMQGLPGEPREWVAFHHHPRPKTLRRSKPKRWARDARWQLFEDGRLFDTWNDPLHKEPLEGHPEVRERLERGLAALPRPE